MTLKRGTFSGDIIESATDPAADASYVVTSETKWLDTSYTPARMKERNAANTAWLFVAPLGRHTETFTATGGQTTYTLAYTPAGVADIDINIDGWPQPNSNITNLTDKTLTFTALDASMVVTFTYTRLD